MKFPTRKQALAAPRAKLCRWWQCLPTPRDCRESSVLNDIYSRLEDVGGFPAVAP